MRLRTSALSAGPAAEGAAPAGPELARDLRRRDEQTVALLWEELARTDPVLFSILWRKAHRAAPAVQGVDVAGLEPATSRV